MPDLPFLIFGTIYDEGTTNGSASNNLTLRNESTNEIISTITNSNGQYIFDLANLTSGYSDEDFIKITATGGTDNGQILKFKAVCKEDQAQVNELSVSYKI